MIGAIVKNDIVAGLLVINEEQIEEMQAALGCEIVDAGPYGLIEGDLRTARGWTRNVGGEQIVLELQNEEERKSYELAMERALAAEEQAAALREYEEAAKILLGEEEA